MEGALVSCVIAQKQRQTFFVDTAGGKAVVLKAKGALGEPPGLGHLVNEQFFGGMGGLVFFEQVLNKRFEGSRILAWHHELAGGQSVFERVAGGSRFAFG